MAKKQNYVCTECGHRTAKWMGKCSNCGSWNTIEEEVELKFTKKNSSSSTNLKVYNFNDVEVQDGYRYTTGLKEFDRVLGGGLVKGEVVLLTGSPGVGKSTLLLQVIEEYAEKGKVLYISGEESASQIKYRGQRLNINHKNIYVINETEIESIISYISQEKPIVVIIDSIQTLYSSEVNSIPGTITQIRETTLKTVELAKANEISFFIVGHITKDGKVAGPKLLEHMVDCVLHFEGDEGNYYRILRSIKNRFGSTNEIGIFNMGESGISEIKNPSEFFLSERDEKNAGSIVVPVVEGSKIFLLEVQSLLIDSAFGLPRRTVQGYDKNRIQILNAVVEKKMGLMLGTKDLFVNIPGGISIKDTSADLAVVMSIASAYKNVPVSQKIAAVGELGLRGELRKVAFIDKRLKELEKLGFKGAYIPEANRKDVEKNNYKIKVIFLKNLNELVERMK